jgi:hypothetical protein
MGDFATIFLSVVTNRLNILLSRICFLRCTASRLLQHVNPFLVCHLGEHALDTKKPFAAAGFSLSGFGAPMKISQSFAINSIFKALLNEFSQLMPWQLAHMSARRLMER